MFLICEPWKPRRLFVSSLVAALKSGVETYSETAFQPLTSKSLEQQPRGFERG